MAAPKKIKLTPEEQAFAEYTYLGALAGCPVDQMANFFNAGVILQPKQLEIVAACRACDSSGGPKDIMAGGGRGAAKQVKCSESMFLWRSAWSSGKILHMIKRADEVKIGDFLIGSDGQPKKVLAKSIPEFRQFYRVSFDDGASLEVSDCHLWTVFDLSKRAPEQRERGNFLTTVETKWLAEQPLKYRTQNRFAIPVLSSPVNPPNPTTPELPPYTLGYWLGNGFRQGSYVTCHSDDMAEICGYIAEDIGADNVTGKIYSLEKKAGTILMRGWIQMLHKAKWPCNETQTASRKARRDFVDDRICIDWRRWSPENRFKLLAGLVDSDGTLKDLGNLEFDSKDIGLAQLVRNLLQSLGFKPYKINTRVSKKENRSVMYRVTCSPTKQVFRLKRKAEKLKLTGGQLRATRRYIVGIEKIGFEEGICFRVDSEDHLYVAGNEYILTHNTHAILAQIFCDDCQRMPGLKVLVLRKVGRANKEQISDFRKKLLGNLPHKYREQQSTITFENGSLVILGNFKDERDIDKYLGLEYDVIHIVESNQLSLTKKKNIISCLRTNKTNWRTRCYEDTNPGGIGHFHNKQIFVEPWKARKQTDTRYIHCTVDDNKFVDADYKKILESYTGWQREAWLHGSWDFMAGAFFTNFVPEIHVYPNAKVNFLPKSAIRWMAAYDFGFAHNTAFLLAAQNAAGEIFIVAEYLENERTIEEVADDMRSVLRNAPGGALEPSDLSYIVAGRDCFNRNEEGKTIAVTFQEHGIDLAPAEVDRINGWARCLDGFGDLRLILAPIIYFHGSCVNLIMQIQQAQHSEKRPGDIEKFNANEEGEGGDDLLDAFRFLVSSDPERSVRSIKPAQIGSYKAANAIVDAQIVGVDHLLEEMIEAESLATELD